MAVNSTFVVLALFLLLTVKLLDICILLFSQLFLIKQHLLNSFVVLFVELTYLNLVALFKLRSGLAEFLTESYI